MNKVTYDGEDVVFEGPCPDTIESLVTIFTGAATSKGKMLLSVKVNGQEVLGKKLNLILEKDMRVDVKSGSQKELFLLAINSTLVSLSDSNAAIDPLLESLLCESWPDAFGKLNGFMRGLAPLLELMSNLSRYAKDHPVAWGLELEKHIAVFNEHLKKILSFSERQQIADLASQLNFEFRPSYAALLLFVGTTVRNSFQG